VCERKWSIMRVPDWIIKISNKQIGKKCTKALLLNFEYQNVKCIKLAVSKAFGIGIILGSAIVKAPQIIKMYSTGSTKGLSLPAYLLEILASVVTLAYNLRQNTPFTTYGECLFTFVQNLVIVAMMGAMRAQRVFYTFLILLISLVTSGLLLPGYVNDHLMAQMQTATIPILVLSRLPQIHAIWREKGIGGLSSITVFLMAAGSLARVYTAMQETSDNKLLVASMVAAASLNSIILLQTIYYSVFKTPRKLKTH